MKTAAYRRLEEIWACGGVVVLDGALSERPDLVQEVHRRYAEAGADVLTTSTWRLDNLPSRWKDLARRGVELARTGAGEAGCAIAFSVWLEALEPSRVPELAAAVAAAGPDLILVETMETIPTNLEFPGYEALLATGLPVWAGYRWTANGPSDTTRVGIAPEAGHWQDAGGDLFAQAARRLEELGVAAILVNCLPREDVPGTLPFLRGATSLPLGAYPNVGRFLNPGWEHDETTTPEAYLADASLWVEEGATIVGGCCGTTPEHIAALARAF